MKHELYKEADDKRKSEAEKNQHAKKNKSGKEKAVAEFQQSLERFQPYQRGSPRCKKIDSALTERVALDMQPMSIVEDLGFLKFLNTLDPRYQPPSRKCYHILLFQKSMRK